MIKILASALVVVFVAENIRFLVKTQRKLKIHSEAVRKILESKNPSE